MTRNSTSSPFNFAIVYYFKSVGIPVLLLFLMSSMTYGATIAMTPSILRAWSESGGLHLVFYTGMYALSSFIAFGAIISVIWYILLYPCNGFDNSFLY